MIDYGTDYDNGYEEPEEYFEYDAPIKSKVKYDDFYNVVETEDCY